ncbi:SLC24A2 [Symbiodinium sp. CCMP2592]|nr:SLC24A2 [Symbiodinium sp. CCMP2592]
MAAFSESGPVFKPRCAQVGLASADVERLEKVGVNSLAKVAFMTSYTPGSGDDKDLIAAFESTLGTPPSVGQKSSFRRLFHEAYAVTTSEMKMLVERTDESIPRKLSVPERSERFEVVSKRLVGLSIKNRLEPADSLVDSFVSQYEQDKLQFVPWEKLVSKEQEASTGAKREPFFSLDSTGKLRSETKVEVRADTSTELLLQLALQRRGIAMEMANILDYHHHHTWVERLLAARLDAPPSTHMQPTLDQCQQADRKLWQLLGEATRSGIQLKAGGRPLIFETTWQTPEVLHLLQPMPRAAGASVSQQVAPPPRPHGPGLYDRPGKGRKGTGKGAKATKGGGKAPPVPNNSPLSGLDPCQQSASMDASKFSSLLQLLQGAQWPDSVLQRKSVSSANPTQSRASSPQHLTHATLAMQAFVQQLNAAIKGLLPQVSWNAICIGRNTLSDFHRDSGNQQGSLNHTFSLGTFAGGQLWLEDASGTSEATVPGDKQIRGKIVVTLYTLSGGQPTALLPLGFPCAPSAAAQQLPVERPPLQNALPCATATSGSPHLPTRLPPRHEKPLFLEICSGSAMLSYVAKEAGYTAVPIDWHHNKQRTCVHTLQLELRLDSTWSFLRRICSEYNVAWVHMAPPCGTASRARECGPGPKPLRSLRHVRGLPGLPPVEQARVDSANTIYDNMVAFCDWLFHAMPHVPFSVENPLHSYLWQLPKWAELVSKHSFVTFDSCLHGSQRKKATALLTNSELLHCLSGPCPGCSSHLPWGKQGRSFATAEETGYPKLLCERIVACVDKSAASRGIAPERLSVSKVSAARAAGQVQPRGRKFPPIISEFAYTVSVGSAEAPTLNSKHCLSTAWHGVPAGAKLLRESVERGGSRLPEGNKFYIFGVYRSMQAFLNEAKLVVHPFDSARSLPDELLRVLFDTLTKSPVDTMRHRLLKLQHWRALAKQLEPEEEKIRSAMDPCVRKVLGCKRIALMKRVAADLSWPDTTLFDDLAAGFKLTGYLGRTGVFASDVKPATMDLDEFWAIRAQKDHDYAEELWNMTLEESNRSGKCWLDGPIDVDSLGDTFPEGWNACRRFAVWQGKWRAIDDFLEAAVNSCFGCFERVTLKALDEICWLCMQVCRAAKSSGSLDLELSSGERLKGPLHTAWKDPDRVRPHCKTYDLQAAYKQLALHPGERPKSIILLREPGSRAVKAFVCNTLPFGASASVMQFNRVALFLQRVLWDLRVAVTCYYDDFPTMTPSFLSGGTDNAVHALMDLFGFSLSEKEKPFSCTAETLGVVLDTSDPDMGRIFVSNKPERAAMLEESIGRILEQGQVDTRELPSLLGKLRFADAQLLGRTGRLALADLRLLGDKGGVLQLTDSQSNALAVLRARLLASRPRAIATSPPSNPVLVFTDGACDPCEGGFTTGVGGVLFIPGKGVARAFGCRVPTKLVRQWAEGRKHIIGQVELYAVVLARILWSSYIDGERCIFFVDHSGVLSACINSNSIDASWRSLLLHLEAADEARPCLPWFHRVPSRSNIADPPSRGRWDELAFLGPFARDAPTCFVAGEALDAT